MSIDRISSHSPSAQLQAHDASNTASSASQNRMRDVLQQLDQLLEALMQRSQQSFGTHSHHHHHHHGHHAHGHSSGQSTPDDALKTEGIGKIGHTSLAATLVPPQNDARSASHIASTGSTPAATPAASKPAATPASAPAATSGDTQPAAGATTYAGSVEQAASTTHVKFLPVLRGDEQQKDAQIKSQADFARAVDQTAKEYGLDPNVFRAQLQVESGAFSQGYQKAMHAEGDLDRAADNNTSIGLGQISRKYLDGREWADGGPGNSRVGGQVVTTAQYENSVTVQLRMAASNLAQRIADHGGLQQGLSYYVSGNDNPNNPSGASYIQKIDAALKDPAVLNPGR